MEILRRICPCPFSIRSVHSSSVNRESEQTQIQTREYGTFGPEVVLLHGGPGAPGYMAPVARELADSFRILEPFQRGSGNEPLTIARHVTDLFELVSSRCGGRPPAIVGHSWGAMLALAFAAAHPDSIACLVLVGCGTFDPAARQRLEVTRKECTNNELRRRMAALAEEFTDADERLLAQGRLIRQVDSYDLLPAQDETERCDSRAHEETWKDMMRLQAAGVYPSAFARIRSPVIMMHGVVDPHPGRLIHAGLAPFLPQLEYREWEQCGHYPWLEREVRDAFHATLRAWLEQHTTSTA